MADRQLRAQHIPRSPAPIALTGLFLLASVAAFSFAANILIPVAFAIFLNLLLSPIVRVLGNYKCPTSVSAAILVAGMVTVAAMLVSLLAEPAGLWLRDAPKSIRGLQAQVFTAKDKIANIQELAEEVDELTSPATVRATQEVVVKGANVFENMIGSMPSVLTFAGIVIFLTYFLLASGDTLLRRMTHCGRSWSEQRRIVTIARQIQSDLSRYLLTVTTINLLLGIAVTVTMHLLEVPNPFLWGAMVALLNFAPYIGAVTSAAVLTIVGLTAFDVLAEALMVPTAFLILTVIEGQLLTPAVVGRRMALSPIFVFLSVIFWGWLWGIAGALMAVPIMTSIKVVCDHVPALEPFGAFIRNHENKHGRSASRSDARQSSRLLNPNSLESTDPEKSLQSTTQGAKA